MGNTRNTGYLQNIVLYDANDNITLPARLAVTGTVSVNNTTPYDTTQFSLDVNGGLIVKNINKTAQFVLINSNPASGGNNAFVVHTVGGTSASSYADIQGYYGTSIAGSTVLRLNPQGGNVLVGSLAGTGSRMVVASSTGVLSTQAIVTLGDLSGVSTARTITINGTTQDLSANRTWTLYTDDISEDGSPVNLWFTNARARAAISVTGSGSYDSATGVITVTGGVTAVNTKTGDVTLTTSDITEGTRLYYTDTRVGTYLTSNSYATQSYVTTQIANLVDSAPGTLDTLNELAAALGDDPNFATSVATSIGTKQAQLNGTGFVKISGTTISYDNSTYLTSFTETDPIYVASSWYSTTNNASNWNTAYGWGNHASAGYLTTSSAASTYASLTGAYANPAFVASLAYSKLTGVPSTFTPSSHTHAISEVTGLQTALDGKQASLGFTPYNATNPSGYITSSSLSSYVPYNGATSLLNLGVYAIFSGNHYIDTPAGIVMFKHGVGTTLANSGYSGIGPSGTDGMQLSFNGTANTIIFRNNLLSTGRIYSLPNASGTLALTSDIPTNLNQLTNGPGYITSYTETDTLASVTGRGASTSSNVTFSGITRLGSSGYNTYINGGLMLRDYGNSSLTNGRFYYQDDAWHFRGGGEGEADVTSDTEMYIRNGNIERLVIHAGNIGSQSVNYANSAGSAGSAGTADNIDGWSFVNTGSNSGTNANTIASNGISYATSNVNLFGQTDGALYSQAYNSDWQHQIYGDYRTGQLAVRGKQSGSWTGWRTIIDSSTIGSQSVSYATTAGSAGSAFGMGYDGNAISGMGPISTWDSRPGVGMAGFGISWHTGVSISGYPGYGGVRLYSAGYPTHASSVLRLEASTAVYTFGGLYSDGNAVIHAGNISSQPVVTIQDAPPSGSAGRLWWESDTGKLKVYYGSAWVDATPIPDSSLFFAKAGGSITGDVSIGQTLNVVGNTLVQGNINAFGDITAYSSSDARLKDNITVIESPLEKLSKINGVSFNWNDKQSVYEVGAKDYGVIAQEVEEVLPELVTTRDNGYKAVRYEKIVSLLIEAIKEQQTQINNLTDKLNKL
jgi:hypothetical protein